MARSKQQEMEEAAGSEVKGTNKGDGKLKIMK
jgi:hypothetical protein